MKHEEIMDYLISLLIKIESGMLELDEPLPMDVVLGVKQAIVGFGEQILPKLHRIVDEKKSEINLTHTADILGAIGDDSSVFTLIDLHRHYSGYESGLSAIQALRDIGSEEGYLYLSGLLNQRALGNLKVFNSGFEMVIACESMENWNSEEAIKTLIKATKISDPNRMPYSAIRSIGKKPEGIKVLENLAQSDNSIREVVKSVLDDLESDVSNTN